MLNKMLVVLGAMVLIPGCDSSGGSSGGSSAGLSVVQVTSGDGCPLVGGTGDAGIMEGVFDITDYGRVPTNVMYTVITPDGGATEFDYQGDSMGNGENCFIKGQEGFSSITQVNGDRYLWTFADPFMATTGCVYASDEVYVTNRGDTISIALSGGGDVSWRKANAAITDLIPCQP